ncbi:MAG: DNA cytosine methyltransferase [Planctomycetota bacterium]
MSLAGKRAGIHDGTRSGLWFEMGRVIWELRPRIVLLENVAAITTAGGGGARVIADLAEMGYDARWPTARSVEIVDTAPERLRADTQKLRRISDDNLSTRVRRVEEWPTAQARDWKNPTRQDSPRIQRKLDQGWSMDLADVATWCTPRAGSDTMVGGSHHKKMLQGTELEFNRSKLNPDWVETLMGYPVHWTSTASPRHQDHNTTGNHRAQLRQENTARRGLRHSVTQSSRRWSTRWQS